ncbi:MAG: ROK family protein [Verrucomicrobiota bacterium]
MELLGIDIGGSGIKASVVDTATGEWVSERHRIETPQPAKYEAIMETLSQIADHFQWKGPVGCGFPGVIQGQQIQTAANLHKSLIGKELGKDLADIFGQPAYLINDADAAGVAEMRFGAGQDKTGVMLFLTIGTGIGSALFTDGKLVENTEFGHMIMEYHDGKFGKAEHYAADSVRKKKDLSWSDWTGRFNQFLEAIHFITRPSEIIVGGGLAKRGDKIEDYLKSPCPLHFATLKNRAGITGAALMAEKNL